MQQTTFTEKTELSLLSQINEYAVYNLWANNTLVNWLKTKPADLMELPIPSSFPNIKETLLHIWDVERSWLGHLNQQPVKSFRFEEIFKGTLADVFEGILEGSEELVLFTQSLTDQALQDGCPFSLRYVGDHILPNAAILQHTFYHSIYHRGQLVTIGRNLGFTDAPMTDYMFYLLRVK